jgi:enoyl-CoA hydratase/carnithine racemase
MTDELVDALGLLSTGDRVNAIVVTGHGHMFCADTDLDEGLRKGSLETVRNWRSIPLDFTIIPGLIF